MIMATIKSYTDIEQSKKLAEILPIESADMWYQHTGISIKDGSKKPIYFPMVIRDCESDEDIPCWSLAALINIIPQEIFDGEYIVNITEGRDNKWIITYDHYEHSNHSYYGLSASADNLVDACTDIIIKLKERNII